MRDHEPVESKRRIIAGLNALARADPASLPAAARAIFAEDSAYLCSHPVNQMHGLTEIIDRLWQPLKHAFPDMERRDDIVMAGRFADADWISATGYYYGTFSRDWLGLPAHGGWAYLRYGEFYKIDDGRIVDAYVILDVIDLMRQAGVNPLPPARGIEGYCPGPATRDGVMLAAVDPAEGVKSLAAVERMIFEGMFGFDGIDHATMNMDRFWEPRDMMWYGPGGIGSTRGLKGFMDFHEIPWNEAFPDFRGGNHVARFGEGAYVASTGWPSIRGTHNGRELFGIPATGKAITIRVMDWWRRDGDWLVENWIFIDIPELLMQLGYDLVARAGELAERRRGRS